MRRYARTLVLIGVLAAVAVLVLAVPEINIRDFKRGGDDALLGLSLGLDLQGGSHLVYQAIDGDTGEPVTPTKESMEALKRSIERRVNASGLGEPIIQLLGDNRLLIQIPGVRDPERAKRLIGETAQLVWKHRILDVRTNLDEQLADAILSVTVDTLPQNGEAPDLSEEGPQAEGVEEQTQAEGSQAVGVEEQAVPEPVIPPVLVVEFTDEGAAIFADILAELDQSLDDLTQGVHASSIAPSRLQISLEGGERPLIYELPSQPVAQLATGEWVVLVGDPLIQRLDEGNSFALTLLPQVVGESADLESVRELLGETPTVSLVEIQGKVDEDIGLTGDDLSRAFASQQHQTGQPIISIEFNSRGTRIFGELTEEIVIKQESTGERDQIAVFLDDEELISPQVQSVISAGSAFIQGRDFTFERVRDLALLMESGRLPVPIDLIQERDVDASLGADSLAKSVVAGLAGLGLVLVFMTLYYRLPGLIASLALLIYATIVLAIFKMLPVTLTLSGIAAAILSVGMAVDANILIFERMKDELRAGRTLMSAINIGFNRAWPAIRDSNVSTLITCAILFWFSDRMGTTVVQGFAATLAIGVVVSMFSAIAVSRTFLLVVANTRLSRRLNWFVPSGGEQLLQLQRTATLATQRS